MENLTKIILVNTPAFCPNVVPKFIRALANLVIADQKKFVGKSSERSSNLSSGDRKFQPI
jgi:hypothetical protein